MRVKLLQPYKGVPAGAVADIRNGQQLIDQIIAIWVPQNTACKLENAELYDKCTHPIKPELLAQAKAVQAPPKEKINETGQKEKETEPTKPADFFKFKKS